MWRIFCVSTKTALAQFLNHRLFPGNQIRALFYCNRILVHKIVPTFFHYKFTFVILYKFFIFQTWNFVFTPPTCSHLIYFFLENYTLTLPKILFRLKSFFFFNYQYSSLNFNFVQITLVSFYQNCVINFPQNDSFEFWKVFCVKEFVRQAKRKIQRMGNQFNKVREIVNI